MMQLGRITSGATLAMALVCLGSCGGGDSGPGIAPAPIATPTPPVLPITRISADTPVAAACNGGSNSGELYANAEVEPFVAVHPANPNLLLGTWQQDRWSNGGARALVNAVSRDGGATWTSRLMPFSRCGGASAGSAGDFERASDPWVDVGPSGVLYSLALSFNGSILQSGSSSAVLASRSIDAGQTWSAPATLVRDGETLFNDKSAITADPTDARYVYAVWDRIDATSFGATLLARSVDSGASWEPARVIHAPTVAAGVSQTLGNRIVVLPDGTLVNLFTNIDTVGGQSSSWLGVLRSRDKGQTWSAPIRVADLQTVGTRDPQSGRAVRDGALLASIAAGPAGSLWLSWQDARFSGGVRDAIALSHSGDGGLNWSAPVAINRVAGVAAFTPSVAVGADGTVGVMHYDLRSDTADAGTLLTSAWLLSSRDGVNWVETVVANPFDLALAPDARGLFLGDYQGLVNRGADFLAVLALSGTETNNRSDIFASRLTPAPSAQAQAHSRIEARPAGANGPSGLSQEAFRRARHQAIVASMERRLPGWAQRSGAATSGPSDKEPSPPRSEHN